LQLVAVIRIAAFDITLVVLDRFDRFRRAEQVHHGAYRSAELHFRARSILDICHTHGSETQNQKSNQNVFHSESPLRLLVDNVEKA